MSALEYHRGDFTITTDTSRIDCEKVHWFLNQYTYWARNRSLQVVQHAMENSLNFGIHCQDDLVGFARVVTDYATFAWLCDVIITPEHRGKGLGIWVVECVTNHPDLRGIRRIILATQDAHGLYQKHGGFKPLANPERWMEKFNPDAG
jgi:GNAT superfamily N-acetyltransferase